jgi:hypothetical protein
MMVDMRRAAPGPVGLRGTCSCDAWRPDNGMQATACDVAGCPALGGRLTA